MQQPKRTTELEQNRKNTLIFFKEKLGFGILILSLIAGVWLTRELVRKYRQENNLTIATFSKEGEYYTFAKAFSQIVAKHNPSISIKVLETKGSEENQQLLKQGSVDLALIQSDTPLDKDTRAIAFLFPELFHLIVSNESNINGVKDLAGKRIALMPKGSRSYDLFWELIAHYGLDEHDLETIALSPQKANEAITKGEVDALFRVSALRNQGLIDLLENPQMQLVSINQGGALELLLPALETSQIPKGAYNGAIPVPQEDLPTVAVRAVLVTHPDLEHDIVYELTRILFEARSDLVREYPRAAMIPQAESVQKLGFMFHAGAKTYYNQDQPSFWEKYAEPIGLLLSVTMLSLSGIWQLKMRLQGKQKNRADMYNLEILKLTTQIHSLEDLEKLKLLRQELFDIFSKVVIDLDKDLITQESFQSFSFTWEVALSSIRHKELIYGKDTNSRKIE